VDQSNLSKFENPLNVYILNLCSGLKSIMILTKIIRFPVVLHLFPTIALKVGESIAATMRCNMDGVVRKLVVVRIAISLFITHL
jgi:hypothetical protein